MYFIMYTDVAELVLKKCTTTNAKEGKISPGSRDHTVTFNNEFLEDRECNDCLLYTSPSPRDATLSRMPSSA